MCMWYGVCRRFSARSCSRARGLSKRVASVKALRREALQGYLDHKKPPHSRTLQ